MKNYFFKTVFLLSSLMLISGISHFANAEAIVHSATDKKENIMDELNPFASDIQHTLQNMDDNYRKETGKDPFYNPDFKILTNSGCYRQTCQVWVRIDKSEQKLYLYVNGNPEATWSVSTGREDYETPDFDTHPEGRIYDSYSSTAYPGGDYKGLGNMPYAVFISGGFAIHGTGESNWPKLGHTASHGCIRLHPDNAFKFNRLVRKYGVDNVWITVE